MIFDTHAHYSDEQFDKDRDELLWGMEDEGVGTIVEIGASMESSREAIRLAEQYPFVYASVGVHPDHVGELNEETFGELGRMCSHGKVRAVGEIGLDYHWDTEPREIQKHWFIRQLELAARKKPAGQYSQPGRGGRYNGDYENLRQRNERHYSLFFLL